MANDSITMRCPHCEGTGALQLPEPLRETLEALGNDTLGMTEMMHKMKCTSQLSNYRLSRLGKLGILQKVTVEGRPKYRLAKRSRPRNKKKETC